MREIIFRGYDEDTKKWYYGSLWKRDITTYCIKEDYDKYPENTEYFILFQRMTDWGLPNRDFKATVKKESIGQCTGLKDKNGTMIFEGDILKGFEYPYYNDGKFNYFAEICWFNDCSAFGIYTFKNPKSNVNGISTGNTSYMEEWESKNWEVIGNIYENPELKNR